MRASNWDRWGADDERGTLNHVTAKSVRNGASLVLRGEVFPLSMHSSMSCCSASLTDVASPIRASSWSSSTARRSPASSSDQPAVAGSRTVRSISSCLRPASSAMVTCWPQAYPAPHRNQVRSGELPVSGREAAASQ
jgi:hypothetical protein